MGRPIHCSAEVPKRCLDLIVKYGSSDEVNSDGRRGRPLKPTFLLTKATPMLILPMARTFKPSNARDVLGSELAVLPHRMVWVAADEVLDVAQPVWKRLCFRMAAVAPEPEACLPQKPDLLPLLDVRPRRDAKAPAHFGEGLSAFGTVATFLRPLPGFSASKAGLSDQVGWPAVEWRSLRCSRQSTACRRAKVRSCMLRRGVHSDRVIERIVACNRAGAAA